ncbi:MAG TPA: hypothetical protein VLA05_08795 [Coriobacteriia bacterium]|nr:hypothetical protein [Coriobacteriia bacterium]
MSFFDRWSPNGLARLDAAKDSTNARLERLRSVNDKPWGAFLLGLLVRIIVIFCVAGVLFWLLSMLRGY